MYHPQVSSVIPCIKVTAKDVADVGHINIVPFIQKSGGLNPSPPVSIYIRQSQNVQSFDPSGST